MLKRMGMMLVLLGLLMGSLAADDFSGIRQRIKSFSLDNGLKFILIEDHSVPIASFVTYVNAGASDERIGIWGISHILEHMAFKGTSEVGAQDVRKEREMFAKMDTLFRSIQEEQAHPKPDEARIERWKKDLLALRDEAGKLVTSNEFDTILKRNGGVGLNAFTSNDQTVYFFSLPSNKLELWAYLESARYVDPVFREFYKEKEVVSEERRMRTENSPVGKLIEQLQALAFKDHPYRQSVVGPMGNIQMISRQDLAQYFKANYQAGNMVIGVLGDVTETELRGMAKKYFARLPKGKRNPRVGTVEPPQLGEKTLTIFENTQPWLVLGYHCPDERHPDFLKFSLLNNLLTSGRTSRLQKRLVVDEKKALAVGSMAGFPGRKYPGLYLIFALPNSGVKTDDLLAAVNEEVDRLKQGLVTDEELNSARKRLKVSIMQQMGEDQGLLISLLESEVVQGSWEAVFDAYNRVDGITAQDIQNLVNEYLKPENRVITRIEKKGEEK